ncbi:MAG: folate family ECF transporter S component [Erysipelotrichaceae bacterium]
MSDLIYIVQALLIILIAGVFYVVGKRFGVKFTTKQLAIAGMLVVLSVVLSFFSLMIPLLGVPSLKIGFAQLPLLLSGFVLSPFLALVTGLVTDLLGLLFVPTNFPFAGFTLNSLVLCLIPALLMRKRAAFQQIKSIRFVYVLFAGILLASGGYLLVMQEVKIGSELFVLTPAIKVGVFCFLALIMGVLIVAIQLIQKHFAKDDAQDFVLFVIAVVLLEVIINLIFTPIWLNMMYGIPVLISMFVRIVKAGVMIPCNIVIGYSLWRALQRVNRNNRV